jgi:ABC-type transport system involved in multi-copper enzyme maturation permease subunit
MRWKFWERIAATWLIALAGALLLFAKWLPVSYQLGLWGLWIVFLAFVFRQGWIRLFGPVLFYDLVRTGRRTRNILLRCIYALALLFILYTVYLEYAASIQQLLQRAGYFIDFGERNQMLAKEMAKFAESFFIMFMEVQFVGIFLLTPAFAAGAIAEEKDRRTLEYLLATDLDDREIVLGKLTSRLLGLVLLVLTGLPILSLIQFFGGVDPDLVLSGFAATGLTMLSLAGLSILVSVYTKKSRDAIVLTYLIVVAYLGISSMSRWLIATPRTGGVPIIPESWSDLLEWFSSGNLFVVIHKLRAAQSKGILLDQVLPALIGNYALIHGLAALAATTWAVARMRAVAMTETIVRKNPAGRWLPRPGMRGKPMMWKEVVLEAGLGFNRLGRIVAALIILASFLPAIWIVYPYVVGNVASTQPWIHVEEAVNQWVRSVGTIVASLVLLGIGIRAAGAVSGEREQQTLDNLLTTPLATKEILFAKWLGSMLSVRWAFLWLCVIWSLGALTGGLDTSCLPWLVVTWFVHAAFMASLGLCLSTAYSSTQRASIWVLTISGMLYGVPLLFSYFFRSLMHTGLEVMAIVPPVAMNWLAFRSYDLDMSIIRLESPMGVLVSIVIGLMIWAGTSWWLWKLTVKRFNILAGRRKIQIVDKTFAAHYPKFRPALSSEKNFLTGC